MLCALCRCGRDLNSHRSLSVCLLTGNSSHSIRRCQRLGATWRQAHKGPVCTLVDSAATLNGIWLTLGSRTMKSFAKKQSVIFIYTCIYAYLVVHCILCTGVVSSKAAPTYSFGYGSSRNAPEGWTAVGISCNVVMWHSIASLHTFERSTVNA